VAIADRPLVERAPRPGDYWIPRVDDNIRIFHPAHPISLCEPNVDNGIADTVVLLLFWVLEDFLWFVRNPAFGMTNFKPEKIWWHKVWWGFMPRDYYVGSAVGVALYAFSLT
jgi:hypothetical protein